MLYLRFDYSYNECDVSIKNNHPYSHMHTSILKNTLRIPVSAPVTPFSFLSIILKYYFNDDSSFTKSLIDSKWSSFYSVSKNDFPFLKV